jgi:ATP-binding cassette, subfamily C, bacterial CydD
MTAADASTSHEARIRLFTAGQSGIRTSVLAGGARALLGATAIVTIGRIIDRAGDDGVDTGLLTWLAVLLLARAVLAVVPPLAATITATRVESDLRRRLLQAVMRVGPWTGRRTGDTVSKATEGVDAVGALAGTFLPQLIGGMAIPLVLLAVIATIDWPTAAVLLAILPLIPLLLRLLEKRFASVSARYRDTADQLAARFLDGIQGLRTLTALDRADAYGDEIERESEHLRHETMRLLRVNQLALLAVDTLFTFGTVVAAAAMAAIRLSAGAIAMGEAVAIVLLGVMLIEPLAQIGRFFYVGAIGRAAASEVRELLGIAGHHPTVTTPTDGRDANAIEFDDVRFSYPDGTRAIDGATFTIGAGERVALVGASGAGKSTIAHLILGLLQPTAGRIRVSGRATLVPQRPFLFHGSVADNLRLAKPDASAVEMWAALGAADLAEAIRRRPEGLDAPVGERGLQLSGGEVQRLAIARALLADADIVVLDEPTSNVDLATEARLQAAVERLTDGRTVVIIAHRRSTIARTDRVLVIDRGRPVRHMTGSEAAGILGPMVDRPSGDRS